MANPEKSAPEALREAVDELLAILDSGGVVLIDDAYDTKAVEALRAAHERPGAYGPHPDDSVDALQEDVRDLLLALGLSDHARPTSCHRVVRDEILPEIEDAVREASIARDLLEEHREPGECLTLMVKRLAAEWQRHEAAREALAEAGVECETVAEGIRTLDLAVQAARSLLEKRKAEAAGGVGLLRRLRAEIEKWIERNEVAYTDHTGERADRIKRRIRDRVPVFETVLREIDRLIAEAEAQPAEEPTITSFCRSRRGWDVCGNALPCKKHSRPAEEPKREPQEGDDPASMIQCEYDDPEIIPKIVDALDDLDARVRELAAAPQEGDDVLREWLDYYESLDPAWKTRHGNATAVLVRRALR